MASSFRPVLLIITLLIGVNSLYSQIVSYPVTKIVTGKNPEGFVYVLPKHLVKVDVYVTKSEKFKGRYSDFATKLLGITDPITKDVVSYDISHVEISTLTSPDTSQVYFAEIPSKMDDDHHIMIHLTEEGFISGFSTIQKEEVTKKKGVRDGAPFSDLLKPVLIEKVDTIIRRVSIDTSVFVEKVPRRSISEKSTEQQAKEIADQIYKIEDSKYKLITGYQEVNYTGESIELMLNKLNALEHDYLAHFKGSVITTENLYTFYYTPEASIANATNTLFRFSSAEGITTTGNQSGDPVSISVNSLKTYAAAGSFEKGRVVTHKKDKGIYYRIPELAGISVNLGGRTLASEKLRINQLGTLTFLPPAHISHVAFDRNGALQTLIIE